MDGPDDREGQVPEQDQQPQVGGDQQPGVQQPRSESILPKWAQDELGKARAEAAKFRTEKKQAEEAKAKADGDYKRLFEERDAELERLRADNAEKDRIALAKTVAKAVLTGLVADTDLIATRLVGKTEEELRADADKFKAALPKPQASSTEGGAGAGGGSAGNGGLTEAELKDYQRAKHPFAV